MSNEKLFGTSGIRGPAATLFTPQFCFDIGRAFAIFLDRHQQHGTVSIGIDTRTSSPHIAQNLVSGLVSAGREVIHLGAIPVPAANYSLLSMGVIASLMVTGSHIDAQSNGVKFFCRREEISKEEESEIESIYRQIKNEIVLQPLTGSIPQSNQGTNNYLEMLLSLIDHPLSKMKIVVDSGNGGQTEIIKTLLREIGADFVTINDNIQDDLISRDTEQDGAFATLQETVKRQQADLGVGFDSDGDRCIFIDSSGDFIPGDYSGTILAQWNAADTVICPVNVSNVVNFIGKEVVRTKVGSPYVVAAIRQYGSNFGFESNGGCIHADTMLSRDGGATFAKMLNILKWSQKPIRELVNQLPKFHIYRGKFACPVEKYQVILEKAPQFLTNISIDRTDGIKLILDQDTWILFRPSGNAPEFRVFVESASQTKAVQLLDHAMNFASNLVSK